MKILLNILTHGDETIGIKVANELKKLKLNKNIFKVNIANKKAYKNNLRYIDSDLNRSFPGKSNGNYEERLAYKIAKIIPEYDIVFDIHSTISELKDTIIITKLNNKTKKILDIINPEHVLIMNVDKEKALINKASIGIAFEYGKNTNQTANKVINDIKKILIYLKIIPGKLKIKNNKTKYFNVFDTVEKKKGYKLINHVENYKLIKKGEKFASNENDYITANYDFYPIIFSNDGYENIFGFASRILTNFK